LTSLFCQPNIDTLSVQQLIAWGNLFSHDNANIRVAAGRLVKQQVLRQQQRGLYSVGEQGKTLQTLASGWRCRFDQLTDWDEHWLCAYTAHLGRSDKKALRKAERAFRLVGFRSLDKALWCRPNNLQDSTELSYQRLIQLGLNSDTILMVSRDFSTQVAERLVSLWDKPAIDQKYQHMIALLAKGSERLNHLPLQQATRESFLLGEYVIRQINLDPMLPDNMIDSDLRSNWLASMEAFDQASYPIWKAFIDNTR
jgi:phenylacetic acid degradation operon negative regulatory protein